MSSTSRYVYGVLLTRFYNHEFILLAWSQIRSSFFLGPTSPIASSPASRALRHILVTSYLKTLINWNWVGTTILGLQWDKQNICKYGNRDICILRNWRHTRASLASVPARAHSLKKVKLAPRERLCCLSLKSSSQLPSSLQPQELPLSFAPSVRTWLQVNLCKDAFRNICTLSCGKTSRADILQKEIPVNIKTSGKTFVGVSADTSQD